MNKRFLMLLALVAIAAITYRLFTQETKPVNQAVLSQPLSLQHLGIIMDGNRRWAKQQGLSPWFGHKEGTNPARTTIEFCLKNNIPHLTLYAFSLENFKRPFQELDYLFDVLAKELASTEFQKLCEQGVRVHFAGDRSRFPVQLRETISTIEEATEHNSKLQLNLLFCYGGRQEIINATKQAMKAALQGELYPEDLDEASFKKLLWCNLSPAPELIIRTGKAHRLSNFLTFESAYSELYFLDCFWPEVTEQDLIEAVNYFEQCKRNFGT